MTSQPTLETVGPNPQYRELEEELRRVTNTLEDARGVAEMTSKHPSVLELEKKIASLKQRLETTPKEITLHRTYAAGSDIGTLSLQLFAQRRDEIIMQLASAQSRVELADAEMKRLNAHLEGYMKLMAEFGPLRQEYLQILKERDDAQAKLKVWEDRSSPIQMALAAEVANRRTQYDTVQNADTQFRPSFPTLPMVLGFALLGGLAFGGGLVFLMNAMDRSVTTPEEAAHCFGLPILGSIGEIVTPRQKAMRRLRNATVIPAVSLVLAVCLSLSVLSVVLWLQYPEHFKRWKAGPMSFVAKQVLGTAEGGR